MTTPRPRTILITADATSFSWGQAIALSREFTKDRISVALAVMGGALSLEQRAAASRIPNLHVFQSWFPTADIVTDWTAIHDAGKWLLDLAAKVQPDIVQLHDCVHAALPWPVPTVVSGMECPRTRWEALRGSPPPFAHWEAYRRHAQKGMQTTRLLIAQNRFLLARLSQHYGSPAAAQVIFGGFDQGLYPVCRKEAFVFAAADWRRHTTALAIYARATAATAWPAFATGSPRFTATQPVLREIGFCGDLTEEGVREWMLAAGIFCLPVSSDDESMSPMKAALSGCALLLSDTPVNRELWDGAAILTSSRNASGFARALCALVKDPDLRATYQRAARQRGLAYSSERASAQFLKAYSTLLKNAAIEATRTGVGEC